MKSALEVRILETIQKGKWRVLGSPLSWIFALAVRGRHWLYDHKWLAQKYAPLPVVSIGNLVVGGVGKTQVALLLAQSLQDVAILSRGFRGNAEKQRQPLLVSSEIHTAEECGDEPWLLASRLPEARVIVNRNRYLSALEAKKLGARVLLLDDGMQHRRLFRDIEIVVLGGSDPLGGGHFLPRGLLREDPKRLARADMVVFVGKPTPRIEKRVAELTEAPCIETHICVKGIHDLNGDPFPCLKGTKVGLFCGIGNPNRFVASIEALGAVVVASYYLPDHKRIREKELQRFTAFCKEREAEYLLCTEKDRVKLPEFAELSELPIGWVEVELEIVKNREAWEKMTKEITLLTGMSQ